MCPEAKETARFDDSGWLIDPPAVWPLAASWSLLSPDAGSRMDGARWRGQAERFFRARVTLVTEKRYPDGSMPRSDLAWVDVGASDGEPARVCVQTMPLERAPEIKDAALAAVRAIGGAGFDVLVARGVRLWQVDAATSGDARAPLVLAAVLASVLLAPVVPPGGGTIFGVKGCRERLAKAGWRGA